MTDPLPTTVADWAAALRQAEQAGPAEAKALYARIQQATVEGKARGGLHCCGTTGKWHQPWCFMEPRQHATPPPPAPPPAAQWVAGEHIRRGHAACLDRAGNLVAATEQRMVAAVVLPYVLGHAGEDIPEGAAVYRSPAGLLHVGPDPAAATPPRNDLAAEAAVAARAVRAAEEQLRHSDRIIKLLVSRLGGQVQFNDADLAALDASSLVSSCHGLHTMRLRIEP